MYVRTRSDTSDGSPATRTLNPRIKSRYCPDFPGRAEVAQKMASGPGVCPVVGLRLSRGLSPDAGIRQPRPIAADPNYEISAKCTT